MLNAAVKVGIWENLKIPRPRCRAVPQGSRSLDLLNSACAVLRDCTRGTQSCPARGPPALPALTRRWAREGRVSETWGICTRRAGKLYKARSRLYRRRFLRPNIQFAAFFEIYKICIFTCPILFLVDFQYTRTQVDLVRCSPTSI